MKIKILSSFLALSLLLSDNVIVLANTIEINSDTSQSVDVSADIASSYTVTIPKSIVIDGDSKTAEYQVSVTGDIAGNEYVSVLVNETIMLSSNSKDDVEATVSLDKTEWFFDEMDITGNGDIDAQNLSAGQWSGVLNFDINLNIFMNPGLYNADGVMLASWEDSGIDVEKGYASNTYNTDESSPYVVLSKEEYATVTQVVIPQGVTSIGRMAFVNCRGLTNITIPEGVTSIDYEAFGYCYGLTSITIPESVTNIAEGAFRNTPWLATKQAENPFVVVNGILIDGTTTSGDIIIPDGITSIGDGVFEDCTDLTSITIPESVTSIDSSAFKNCTNLSITWNGTTYTYDDRATFNTAIKDAGITTASSVWS